MNREVGSRTKTGFRRTLCLLAETVTFNSLKGPCCFNRTSCDDKPDVTTGSQQSFVYEFINIIFCWNLRSLFHYTNELIEEHNETVTGLTYESEEGEELDMRNKMLIPRLKEEDVNCSYYTLINIKSNLLNYTEKGLFSNWPEMSPSRDREHGNSSVTRRYVQLCINIFFIYILHALIFIQSTHCL